MLWISIIIALIALIIGSITDIRKREVNDYVSYGLIIISFGISIIYSILTGTFYILQTIMGFRNRGRNSLCNVLLRSNGGEGIVNYSWA
ncbi:MAG: hypothetical protein KatS3mg002_0770 [Candidatus Woesearchaeota archaeon]|nr:MAG: hypothetical protein KatS3mg002_0770 [Candidatus Woesearchaeota archaeon]